VFRSNIKANENLEARQVALLVQTASNFSGNTFIEMGDKTANAKSIMGVLALGISKGDIISISADENEALQALIHLKNFFEEA